MITVKKYQEAVKNINLALTQLKPDGNSCAICGDNDHQAWECQHNPVVLSEKIKNERNICKVISELTSKEGENLTIFCSNPDFDGPAQAIECSQVWCEGTMRYEGESLLECLELAVKERNENEQI